jgi:hypothetical protein
VEKNPQNSGNILVPDEYRGLNRALQAGLKAGDLFIQHPGAASS